MKKILTITAVMGLLSLINAQVIITEDENPALTNSSVLLEFGTENKGIILPSVSEVDNPSFGTFAFNTTDKSVQVYEERNNAGAGGWTKLTEDGEGIIPVDYINSGSDVGDGVVIGAASSGKKGILVLESTTQALVLPKVASPHDNIPSPIAGTMVYDTDADMIAVFDGENWYYWK